MIINVVDEIKSIVGTIFCEILNEDDIIKLVEPDNPHTVEVEFKINGKEYDIVEILKRWESGFEKYVDDTATKMLKDTIDDKLGGIYALADDLTITITDIVLREKEKFWKNFRMG